MSAAQQPAFDEATQVCILPLRSIMATRRPVIIILTCVSFAHLQKELGQFLEQEQSKAKMQASIHELTDKCWNTCITGSLSGKFSRSEASCLENCVDRFLDTSLFIVKQIEQQKAGMH
ncbi:Mitochondrial import inner membrane translocase subunit tim8 [Naganishia adeliensis]|uniref:Mitochondrial import inner membrane translocase subunit tim8 n=1 Tax=Naganishia adeliensis TaxID=92952 RepID=A0ACC2WZF0_9TREE|nr:Mitochondrial import inner membrane translocase subunit tim8 [Naganishia adeliensis]